jgi:ATP dependent DNA ligase domain
VWDLLDYVHPNIPTEDMKRQTYRRRYNVLKQILEHVPSARFIHLVETAWTLQEKITMLQRAKAEGWEGIVIKDLDAPYRPGRNGSHFKLKFEQFVSVIVGKKEKPNDHRSVGIYVMNGGGKLHYLGDVGVPDKYPLPPQGAVIDVRVLYQHSLEGKATQAKYFGKVRDDVRPDQCTREQLRVKQEQLGTTL